MSGRAYARDPSGGVGGATDINSFIPHRFRIAAPKVANKAKELAIRRAIQRKCKEKNWKKMLLLRHTRLVPLEMPELEGSEAKADTTAEQPSADTNGNTTAEPADTTEAADSTGEPEVTASDNASSIDTTANELQREKEEIEQTKQQLLEMEEKLKVLSHEKHEKFQQLKDLLIAEARAKSTPAPAKKRRLDTNASLGGSDMSPRMTGASGDSNSPLPPGIGLTRAQSYGGPTTSTDFRQR